MDHKDIIDKWIGGKYAESAQLGYQCVSWAKKYCEEASNPINGFSGSAYMGWKTGSPFDDKWARVPTPSIGSVVFFDITKNNPYGHVAIVDSFDDKTVTFIEQNGGNGNGDGKGNNAIRRTTLKYDDERSRGKILGYFTLKKTHMEPNVSEFKQIYIKERPRTGYEPIFTDFSGDRPATISDVKYLLEIMSIRLSKK